MAFAPKKQKEAMSLMPDRPAARLLTKLISLPRPEERRPLLFPVSWIFRKADLKQDTDYLIYKAYNLLGVIGGLLLVLLLVDIRFGMGLFGVNVLSSSDKLQIARPFSNLMTAVSLAVFAAFYLRIRLSINLRDNSFHRHSRTALTKDYSRKKWLKIFSWAIVGCVIGVLFPFILVERLTGHYHQQNNLLFVLCLMAFATLMQALGASLLIQMALMLEKTIRFFPEISKDPPQTHE